MKLTRRQATFIRNLLDLYRETHEPVHYSVLAERLGVSRFTAYDMLRLLEAKGFVTSDYQLTGGKSGPGRSEIVFAPTPRAHQLMAELVGNVDTDWETIREQVLAKMRSGQGVDRQFERDMLARIPPAGQEAMQYCVEVMTIVALRLHSSVNRKWLAGYLAQLLPARDRDVRASLSLLGGFALGILAQEISGDRQWQNELLEHLRRYQSLVAAMDLKLCRQLARRLRNILASSEKA